MRITVYVPCHNNEATVREVLRSLRAQTRPADQFLFINDRCTDQSPAIAREEGFEVFDLVGRKGLAAGRNLALAHANGDVLLGLDADAIAQPDYLAQLEKLFMQNPQIAAIGGRLDEKFTDTPADRWRALHLPQHHGPHDLIDPRLLFGSTTAVRVPVARQVGGWDERFLTNHEDVDLSTRLKAGGFHLLYTNACRAWHLRRDTPDSVLRTHWNWNYFGYEHCFANLATWVQIRMAMIWATYRRFRILDSDHPSLGPITLLFPWSWTLRDLHTLRNTAPEVGDLRDLIAIANQVLPRLGCDSELRSFVTHWISRLIDTLESHPVPRPPLHEFLRTELPWLALESIPDANYWRTFEKRDR